MTDVTIGSILFIKAATVDCFNPSPERCRRMPYRPNYRLQRTERDRVKKAKKEEKIKQQQERAALRKGENPEPPPPEETERP